MLLAEEDAEADGASGGALAEEAGGVAVGFPLDVEVPGALVDWTSWRVRRIMSSMAAASAALQKNKTTMGLKFEPRLAQRVSRLERRNEIRTLRWQEICYFDQSQKARRAQEHV